MSAPVLDPVLIIGNGFACYLLARELRKQDPQVPLHLVSCDDGAFYSKSMLSNGFSAGKPLQDLVGKTSDVERQAVSRHDAHLAQSGLRQHTHISI